MWKKEVLREWEGEWEGREDWTIYGYSSNIACILHMTNPKEFLDFALVFNLIIHIIGFR